MKWDILLLSASQIKAFNNEVLSCGHHLFNSGNEISRSNGPGFLVNKNISSYVCDYQGLSDRFDILSLRGKENKILFIQVYFPSSHPDYEVEKTLGLNSGYH